MTFLWIPDDSWNSYNQVDNWQVKKCTYPMETQYNERSLGPRNFVCYIRYFVISRGGSSFFPRGGFDPSSTSRFFFTSREAASRFFFVLFYEPRSGEPNFFWPFCEPIFLAILRAAKRRADFFWLFWTPVSDVFLASTNAMETMITSLAAQGGGGGGG